MAGLRQSGGTSGNLRMNNMRNRIKLGGTSNADSNSDAASLRMELIHNNATAMMEQFEEVEKTKFESKYVQDILLGQGMHASVYKCFKIEDVDRNSPLAVKISKEDDEEKKQASINEFKMTNNLDHSNVVKSIEIFENNFTGEIHQIMEYVEG